MVEFKLSKKQSQAVEKVTGRYAADFCLDALGAYFAWTDKGEAVEVREEAKADLDELLLAHHTHSITVELWKEDFKSVLLFLSDFLGEGYPPSYIKHVFDIYEGVFGFIPSCYRNYKKREVPDVDWDRVSEDLLKKEEEWGRVYSLRGDS